MTLSDTSDSDDVLEEHILFETIDEDSDDDAECPYCKQLLGGNGLPASNVTSGVTKSAPERMNTRNSFARSA
jgi:hypothetical protein